MNLQYITPTTFVSDFVLLRTPAVGVRRCLSFSPLFFDCYVILISSNTWTLQDEEVKNQTLFIYKQDFEKKNKHCDYPNYEMLFD